MNILVTLNSNYVKPLIVMLQSLFMNNPHEEFHIYLMHSSIKGEEISGINKYVTGKGHQLSVIHVQEETFADAPIVKHYSKEMYFRLLAFKFLPACLDKILYLDPDILVINGIKKVYEMNISDYLYAAAYHDRISVKEINKLRLKKYDIDAYYNSGVLLMNLQLQRSIMKEEEIFDFVERNKKIMILPDQDIINGLYSKYIKNINEVLYNFDARYYRYYKAISNGKVDMDFIIHHTSIIHFCGKKKPWHKNYTGNFHSLYKHYEKMVFQ
ncbi:glycosyl transferase family 8 [Lentibacillus populi]|uniref:Glycosyl transferase family 8 n=1 Tax=Lentibacillus populi TaxID=1827502 RepID=A0A9W5X693_9BACI|nr:MULTISPECIES: glycosyltransferase family 8 protein [Bacillaceae]GGB46588.1 glycosyl transferase family 8 [Lentibacillus populi]